MPRAVKLGGGLVHIADDQPTFWDRVEAGRWEPGTLAVLDDLIDARTTFVDLGAWVGPTTLHAAGRARRVLAVEADPAALDQLRRNLAVNPDLSSRIEVVPNAIHPTAGPVSLGAKRKAGDSMSSVLLARGPNAWTVDGITPAELAARLAGDERIVLKLDIEGAEYGLLPHLGPLLTPRTIAILVSFHPRIAREAVWGSLPKALRGALRPLARFSARPITAAGAGTRSFQPALVRLRLRSALREDEWLFSRA
jgi:FkbM family methyltransferase